MKTKLIASNFKTLSLNELSTITGGELPPMPTPGGGGGGCGGGLSNSPILGGSGGPTLSSGDEPGVLTGVPSSTGGGIIYVLPPNTIKIRCSAI